MDNNKVPSFGRSDKQIADALGMSASDFKKVKKQMVSDMTKPKATAKPTAKAKPAKSPMPKKLTGEAAAKAYRQSISPKGMASASAAQKKALDKKYPGLYKSATPKPKKK
jgi:hypothetical protein